MKKLIKIIAISMITLFSSIMIVSAWNGLIAENGDIFTLSKWNELVNLMNTKQSTIATTNRDDADINSTRYYGVSYNDGNWKVDRETGTGVLTVRTTATKANNTGEADYSSAWTNRINLNY